MDEILAKHKNETKELHAIVQAMKHAVPKGDKKRKKQVSAEIAILEAQLEDNHKSELAAFHEKGESEEKCKMSSDNLEAADLEKREDTTVKISKVARRREQKLEDERKRQKRIMQAEIDNVNSLRNVEAKKLSAMLSQNALRIKEIPPDGNCLYTAIADQIPGSDNEYNWKLLRSMASNQLRNNKDDFLPFMTNPNTDQVYTGIEFYKYCDDVEGTNCWGGHLEIQALSQALKMPIEIFQADSPVLKVGEYPDQSPIRLSYHRHAYGLGEHYNSVVTTTDSINVSDEIS